MTKRKKNPDRIPGEQFEESCKMAKRINPARVERFAENK
jgi:hypothetical protein